MSMRLDEVDRRLVALLQQDATLSYADLGRRVGLSISAVNERVKKLGRAGVIKRWTVIADPEALDLSLCVFILVMLDGGEGEFLKRVPRLTEVQECHHVTGEFAYLLKVRVRNTRALETFLARRLKSIRGVVRTHTVVVLSTAKEEVTLDVLSPATDE